MMDHFRAYRVSLLKLMESPMFLWGLTFRQARFLRAE